MSCIAGIHNRNAGACRHVFLSILKGVFQALQLAAAGNRGQVDLVFEQPCDCIGVASPCYHPFNTGSAAFTITVVSSNIQPGHIVFRVNLDGFCLNGTFDVHIGGGIVIQHGDTGRSKRLIHSFYSRYKRHIAVRPGFH